MTECEDAKKISDEGFEPCGYEIRVSTNKTYFIHRCGLDSHHGGNHRCWHGIEYSHDGEIFFVGEDYTK